MKKDFDFNLVSKDIPYDVIKKIIAQISVCTHDYVKCEIGEYVGEIRSYESIPWRSVSKLTEKKYVDIQQEMGEINSEDNKFEVYLIVKGLDTYKYRICFIEYGSISYPVSIILNDDIALNCMDKVIDEYTIENQSELENTIEKIISSDYLSSILQNLIYEAIRRENQASV